MANKRVLIYSSRSWCKIFFLIISDRHVGGSDAEKADHETKFKEINEAYTILSDARKKATYDAGQDVDQNHHDNYNPTSNNFHSAHHMDAAQMFKAFFGSGPGMHHAYQHHFGGFGGSGNTSGSGHQMPGSFFQFSWFIFFTLLAMLCIKYRWYYVYKSFVYMLPFF